MHLYIYIYIHTDISSLSLSLSQQVGQSRQGKARLVPKEQTSYQTDDAETI